MIWEETWWHMSSPQRMIETAANQLLENGTVLLRLPEDLSWRHGLRAAMEEKICEWNGEGLIFEELDIRDDCPGVSSELDAGYAVIHALKPGGSSGYRPGCGSIAQYICSEQLGLFNERVLWIKGFHNEAACKAFCALCKHVPKGKSKIILEDTTGCCKPGANLHAVNYKDYVSPFDVQLLCMVAANTARYDLSQRWREYIAVLAANLAGMDVELASALICDCDLQTELPIPLLTGLSSSEAFVRRGSSPDHVFYHLKNDVDGGRGYVNRRVWRSQMQVGLPILEYMQHLIRNELSDDLQRILEEEIITQYKDQRITDINDVEAGTMVYMMGKGFLSVPSPSLRARIRCVHENRNRIAHHEICTNEQIDDILQLM